MLIRTFTPESLPLKDLDWVSLVPLIGRAREALARFDERLASLNEEGLEVLKWEEAIASLRASNVDASVDELIRFMKRGKVEDARDMALRKIVFAKEAIDFSIRWAKSKPINIDLFCRLHGILKRDAPNPKEIGKVRSRQNWIGPEGGTIEEAFFYPPPAKKVIKYLQALSRYSRKAEKDPLVQCAILFAQFLIIHPFMDGNGRVARISIPLYLVKKKLLSKP